MEVCILLDALRCRIEIKKTTTKKRFSAESLFFFFKSELSLVIMNYLSIKLFHASGLQTLCRYFLFESKFVLNVFYTVKMIG